MDRYKNFFNFKIKEYQKLLLMYMLYGGIISLVCIFFEVLNYN